jgi:hypothetical protein
VLALLGDQCLGLVEVVAQLTDTGVALLQLVFEFANARLQRRLGLGLLASRAGGSPRSTAASSPKSFAPAPPIG